jgi:nicotinate-nucleotide adenylyltransferase
VGAAALGGPLTTRAATRAESRAPARTPGSATPATAPEILAARVPTPGSVGILGGTFDPVHIGHLAAAEEVREALGLERILFVPAGLPPHKPDRVITAPSHRFAMVQLAIEGNVAFEASRVELDRSGPSYTIDTLQALARRGDGEPCDLTLILSAESFRGLPSWHEPERLFRLARIAIVPRGGLAPPGRSWLEEHFPGVEARVVELDAPRLRLSATDIRARVAAGRSIRYLVPDAVIRYIEDHDLYRDETWRKN